MRALIRGEEIITEPFSPWVEKNMMFLIGQEKDADGNYIPGDGWALIENYEPPAEVNE